MSVVIAVLTWEAVAALGSIASTLILLVGAIAAVVQIRHLRLANQLEGYLQLMHEFNSSEMSEARAFVESADFTDPEALRAATQPQLDGRIRRVANHFQNVARLLNLGLLDERLFLAHVDVAAGTWRALRPVIYEIREKTGKPILIDVEYLVYRTATERMITKAIARYPKAFLDRNNLGALGERSQTQAEAASSGAHIPTGKYP